MTAVVPMPLQPGEQSRALDIARGLAAIGIPVFAAPPDPAHPVGYRLPEQWQHTRADPAAVDAWQPGWALCALGGVVADWIDTDPRNGGAASREALQAVGAWPRSYGQQMTPSGGTHDLIAPLRAGKGTPAPGIDLQGGREDGSGRGFVFIAPTVRVSKVDRKPRAYRWRQEPDFALLKACGGVDTSGSALAAMMPVRAPKEAVVLSRPPEIFCHLLPCDADKLITEMLSEVTEHAGDTWNGFRATLCQRAAFTLGGLAGSEYLSAADAERKLIEAIEEAGQAPDEDDLKWIRDGLTEGSRAPLWVRKPQEYPAIIPLDLTEQLSRNEAVSSKSFADKIIDAADLDSLADPEPLIEGWLYRDTVARLVGQPGSYKSFVALDMACCVALGRPWHGHEVAQSTVLYVVGEGLSGYKRRVRAWCAHNGVELEQLRGKLLLTRGSVQIKSAEWMELSAWVIDHDVQFVIGDTQAKMTTGVDESSNTDQGVVISYLDHLREATGATLLLLHHTGHPHGEAGERGRGASSWRAAMSTELFLAKTGDLTAVLHNDRQKEAESGQKVTVRMSPVAESLAVSLDSSGEPLSARSQWLSDQVAAGVTFSSGTKIADAARQAGHAVATRDLGRIFDEYFELTSARKPGGVPHGGSPFS